MSNRLNARRIEDYALVGDGETSALIGRNGSVDWLCWPRFDSDACFAALLGDSTHGRWLLTPRDARRVSRTYLDDTLILATRFETDSGEVTILDFMPPRGQSSNLVRIVCGERGDVRMRMELTLRFGYGATVPWVTHIGPHTWRAIAGPDMTLLHTRVNVHGEDLKSVADFTVGAGERIPFVLTYSPSNADPTNQPDPDAEALLHKTEEFWRAWVSKGRSPARWSSIVTRSLITLRALIYRPTGGIIAAPTTSLPELVGGERNWDYRYCWLRDASKTLLALMNGGYNEEATHWRDWLLRAIAGSPRQMQIMYGLAGERRLTETELPWLPGFKNSQPVRIGNGAYPQLQLDAFGEVMNVFHQARDAGLHPTEPAWALQCELLGYLEDVWRKPDYGLWEIRGPPQHFTFSKIMSWVAFDRGIADAEHYDLPAPVDRWRNVRARIFDDVCANGFDETQNSFVQSYGSSQLDASLLLIGAMDFLPADDPRVLGTVKAIEKTLLVDGLVMRYDTTASGDGLPPGEGAFLACSFWLADAYLMSGRRREAEQLFERVIELANDVGLLAEEYDTSERCFVGNFPQAFSHLALVNTAFNLCKSVS
jgi:GH15 family glucan-1,4-alpha-glucosidase